MSFNMDFKNEYRKGKVKSIGKWILTAILCIAFIVVVAIPVILFIIGRPAGLFSPFSVDNDSVSKDSVDTIGPGYAVETRYIGGIGYPQVYEEPFKQTSFYVTNKELWERIPDVIPGITDTATGFMNTLMNSGYRAVAEDKNGYISSLLPYLSENYPYNEVESEGYSETAAEFVGNYADWMVENNVSMEANFITDTSLVYEDALMYVRGIVEYTVFSSDDERFPVTGQKQAMMMEVVLMRDGLDPSTYKVVDWYQLDLPESK